MFQKILCAFDFSEPSRNALVGALRIAHQNNARLLMVNVMDVDRIQDQEAAAEIEARVQRMKETVADKIREYFPATGKEFSRQVEILALKGNAVAEMLRAALRESPDLVVIATHGRTGLFHFMLGSVAEKVIRHSTSPVLLVRKPTNWPPKKILLPVDFSESGEEAALLANQLKPEKVELLHVLGMPDLISLPDGQAASSIRNGAALREEAIKKLQELRSQHESLKDASIHVAVGPPSEEICQRAKEEDADLILMPTQGRSGLSKLLIGSVAERVARHAPCNVLTFSTKSNLSFRRELLSGL